MPGEDKLVPQTHKESSGDNRILQWRQLIATAQTLPEIEKLQRVNHFFNQFAFVEDEILWKQKDYWATPDEFILQGAGDCEDFSIAKYFTLQAMGVDDAKMRLTYVKALKLNQAHMVLSYFPDINSMPLVLDNLINDIISADLRKDLLPVYSFNGNGLWMAKRRGQGRRVGQSDDLNLWFQLKQRMVNVK